VANRANRRQRRPHFRELLLSKLADSFGQTAKGHNYRRNLTQIRKSLSFGRIGQVNYTKPSWAKDLWLWPDRPHGPHWPTPARTGPDWHLGHVTPRWPGRVNVDPADEHFLALVARFVSLANSWLTTFYVSGPAP
jgi:hypothetical protein